MNKLTNFEQTPPVIQDLMESVIYGIAKQENLDPNQLAINFVTRLNKMPSEDWVIFLNELGVVLDKSINGGIKIDKDSVDERLIKKLCDLVY